ncbi:MAG: peptidylprolyl isomerase [Pacificimonas sp.]
MTKTILALSAALFTVTPALAQFELEELDALMPAPTPTLSDSVAETTAEPTYELTYVKLGTEMGDILLALETERAPITTKNFLRYLREGRLAGQDFYRASNIADGYGLVQAGTQGNPKFVLPAIAHEPTSRTGLTHTDGTISMAMGEPGTADGDFFIIMGDMPSLDAKDGQPGFAAFGRVVDGMDTVRAMLAAPTDPNEGEGVMKGQYLADPVTIRTADVVDAPVTVATGITDPGASGDPDSQ